MNISWNASDYTKNFLFLHQYGEDVLSLLDVVEGGYGANLGFIFHA